MASLSAVIEITNSKIKLVAGYVIDNKPVIIYSASKDIAGMVNNGKIIDREGVVLALKQITFIENQDIRLKLTIKEATIILPPIGFTVFHTKKSTNVISQTSIIEQIDINNVLSLASKEKPNNGNLIVDIVPIMFTLENNKNFVTPPLGEKSDTLELFASLHTLSPQIISNYMDVFNAADIRVKNAVVSTYALAEYIKKQPDFPSTYILIDMGHAMTSFSVIGKGAPYDSQQIASGMGALIKRVSESFAISEERAYELINLYGIDHRELSFKPTIASSIDEFERKTNFNQEHLNTIILNFLADYFALFISPMRLILSQDQGRAQTLPLVFTGSLIRIPGIKEAIKERFSTNESINFLRSDTIGASLANYCACVGGLIISNKKTGSLNETHKIVGPVSRS